VIILDERFILGRKAMRRLFWLGTVIGALLLSSCGGSEKKASPKDAIGDEEYRVMSAVLKAEKMRRNAGHREGLRNFDNSGDSTQIARRCAAELAKMDSSMRQFGHEAWHIGDDPIPGGNFYDSLVQKYGVAAYYVVRNPRKCGPLYDSLAKRYGNLSYYVTVDERTLDCNPPDSPIFYDRGVAGKVSRDLIQSFDTVNLISYGLHSERFTDSLLVVLISREDVDSTLSPIDWWPAFYERYPLSDGTISISRIGFNPDTTMALLRIVAVSGPLSGVGWLSVLEKKNGQWIVVAEQVDLRI
jgi:hypothetical protein